MPTNQIPWPFIEENLSLAMACEAVIMISLFEWGHLARPRYEPLLYSPSCQISSVCLSVIAAPIKSGPRLLLYLFISRTHSAPLQHQQEKYKKQKQGSPCVLASNRNPSPGGYKEMSSIFADHSALVYRISMAVGGLQGLSQWVCISAHHVTWSPNKLWRSNSIFN